MRPSGVGLVVRPLGGTARRRRWGWTDNAALRSVDGWSRRGPKDFTVDAVVNARRGIIRRGGVGGAMSFEWGGRKPAPPPNIGQYEEYRAQMLVI